LSNPNTISSANLSTLNESTKSKENKNYFQFEDKVNQQINSINDKFLAKNKDDG